MLSRYSPSRCCCAIPDEPQNPCPCLEGSFSDNRDAVISGFTYNQTLIDNNRILDRNGTQTLDISFACTWNFDSVGGIFGQIDPDRLIMTAEWIRDTVFRRFPNDVLPSGVKSIITMRHFTGEGADSFAAWYRVVDDVDGYVDCLQTITGYTLIDSIQEESLFFPGNVIWDTVGTISSLSVTP